MCRACVGNIFAGLLNFESGIKRRTFMTAAALGAAGAASGGVGRALAANTTEVIFRGGTILPLAGTAASAAAMAISGGKILAVGSDADVMGLKGASTQIVDLGGRAVLPGLIDPHHHTSFAALAAGLFVDVGFTRYRTRDALLAALRAKAAQVPPGQWLLAYNFDNLLQGGDLTMSDLDGVSADHPVLVWYINMHDAAGNAVAFKEAGVGQDVGMLPGGGHFGRGADGKLDGRIYEESALLKFVIKALPKITPEMFGRLVHDYFKANAALGTTMLHEPGTLPADHIEAFARLTNEGACRASASLMFEQMKGGEAYKALGRGAVATALPNSNFSLYGIKIIGDGSNQTRTGAQTLPYLGSTDKGAPNFDAATMKTMVAEVKAAGWPVLIHCNGDAAIDIALDAIEAGYGPTPPTGINRIEHSTMVRADQLARMKKLGVQPSYLINHVYFYGASYRDTLFGAERASRMDPAGDCVKAGIPFTLHTDAPCSNMGQLQLVQTAVTRRCAVDNSIVGPDQAIALTDALKAVTIHAAAQLGQQDRLGTLEPGKLADLTILESDPYKADPGKIMDIKVSQTWVGGTKKFG